MRLFDFIDYRAQLNPETGCMQYQERRLNYAEASRETYQIAALLLKFGINQGDRVAILAKNCPEYILFYYACARIGAVCVPLNFRLTNHEWRYILLDADAKLICASSEYLEAVQQLSEQLPQSMRCLLLGSENHNELSDAGITDYADVQDIPWERAYERVKPLQDSIKPTDTLYQMYTSGTTGSPKGVMISHANVAATLHQLAINTPVLLQGGHWILVLPVFHAAAALHCFSAIQAGATLFIEEEFKPSTFVETLEQEHINVALVVPAIIKAILGLVPDLDKRDFDALELFIYGASPIDADTLQAALPIFGCDFCQGYGMTEATLAISMLRPDDHRRALADKPELLKSAGRPVLGTRISIRDEQEQPLDSYEVGEICVQGSQLMSAYWQLPEETKATLVDGWLHTGDAGYLDDEGYLYIVDRIKDMIISGGENIYPKEVEQVLLAHPQVVDVAVIGIPDPAWGESPLAFVVAADADKIDLKELEEFCRTRLASYKCPKRFELVADLPLNATGKVLKKILREPYWKDSNAEKVVTPA